MNDLNAPAALPLALTAPLVGLCSIEASAGTGKTWTVSGLVARLIAERGLEIRDILVVTFTDAATAELRDRIRARLADVRDALDGRATNDTFPALWLDAMREREDFDAATARARIDAALRNFDDAAIHTIHGFCQRALAERPISAGRAFDVELITDDDALLAQCVADGWRARVLAASADDAHVVPDAAHAWFAALVIATERTPEAMARWIRGEASRHDVTLIGGEAPANAAPAFEHAARAWRATRVQWLAHRDAVEDILLSHPSLNRNSYREASVRRWCATLDRLACDHALPLLDDDMLGWLKKLGTSGFALKKACEAPKHAVFDAIDELLAAYADLHALREPLLAWFRRTSFERATRALRERLRAVRQQAFDDLLLDLDRALRESPTLGQRLAQRWPAALIDEFQDTDPLQCRIFDAIYARAEGVARYYVGDPKQSIYAFRGADLASYLHARSHTERAGALVENHRSCAGLLTAFNALFTRRAPPFGIDDIVFDPARPSHRAQARLRIEGEAHDTPPFVWLRLDADEPLSKDDALSAAMNTCAARIARMLDGSAAMVAPDGTRTPLQPRDIAVLVGTHREAVVAARALARVGLGSALRSRESVFESAEARDLLVLFIALAQPQRTRAFRAALALDIFGLDATALARLDDDLGGSHYWRQEIARLAQLWRARGPLPMLRDALFSHGGYARIACTPRGERRLTNFAQLGELLQQEQARLHAADALVGWLRRAIAQGHGGTDTELRLESDADLVQVRTIHTSKGLEYAVVFLPTLWTARLSPPRGFRPAFFHDRNGVAALDFDGDPHARETAEREAYEERLRLAYVALTRAKQRCHVIVGPLPGIEASPLAWWLGGPSSDASDWDASLAQHQQAAPDAIAIERVDAQTSATSVERTQASSNAAALHAAKTFRRAGLAALHTASFSAIAHRAPEVFAESPEHDEFVDAAIADALSADEPAAPTPATPRLARLDARFAFPRGAAAGDVLHAMMETIDWQTDRAHWLPAVHQGLASLGVEQRAGCSSDDVAQWLDDIASTPLPALDHHAPFALRDVPRAAQRREFEFLLPLDGVDFSTLASLAREHDWPIEDIASSHWRGALKGYIDLAFVHRGRWYVADYKSNWLGASLAEYSPAHIDAAMHAHMYRLQALLYTVALHRWLRHRLRDYDYASHVGGAYWMFLRGMSSRMPLHGVAAFTVPRALIEAADALFDTGLKDAA
ncbi:MAG TPA: exodeoxyribonuclease V subunit beta [Burkholderiaceae bacterium]|nr:exodeoxyribonuclease V subunit beta [Burkholderiaceae bacterium]